MQDTYRGPDKIIPYTQLETEWKPFNYVYMIVYLPDQEEINSALDGMQVETNQFADEVLKDLSAEQSERKRELEEIRRALPAH